MKKFSSEDLKRMAIETINYEEDTNFKRVFDVIWADIDGLFDDDLTKKEKETLLKNMLQLYAQMILMESVNLTLNALKETGTLVDDDYFNS